MLTSALVFAFASALALFILLIKMNIRKVLGYDVYVDILCTIVLLSSFSGTVTGMAAAMIAAVAISAFLLAVKMTIGYERLVRDPHTLRFHWVSYTPCWPANLRQEIKKLWKRLRLTR
jgi:hypothetical protein